MNAPRMATTQPMTHKHCACYYKIRTVVRTMFALVLIIGAMWVGGWVDNLKNDPPLPTYQHQPTQGKVTNQ